MSMIKNKFHTSSNPEIDDYISLPENLLTFIGDSFNQINIHGNPNITNFFVFSYWDEGSKLDCFMNENELSHFLTFKLNCSQHDGFSSVIFDKNGIQLKVAVSSVSLTPLYEYKAA